MGEEPETRRTILFLRVVKIIKFMYHTNLSLTRYLVSDGSDEDADDDKAARSSFKPKLVAQTSDPTHKYGWLVCIGLFHCSIEKKSISVPQWLFQYVGHAQL